MPYTVRALDGYDDDEQVVMSSDEDEIPKKRRISRRGRGRLKELESNVCAHITNSSVRNKTEN